MSNETKKQAFRKGALSAIQTSVVRLSPPVAELKAGDGTSVLVDDVIRMLKRLREQAEALGDPGLNQVAVLALQGLSLTDLMLRDVDVQAKPPKPGARPDAQKEPPPVPLDPDEQRQLEQDAIAILTEHAQGRLVKVEDVLERVGECKHPDHLRRLVWNVKKSWTPSHLGDDESAWGGLDGIRDYLPTRENAVFEGLIRDVGTGRQRQVMLELTKDVDAAWTKAVQRSTSRATGYLSLRYATQEVGERLSRLHGLKLPVRIEANARLTIKDGAPADFCVTNAYAWNVTEQAIQTAVEEMVADLRGSLPVDPLP